MARKNIVFGAGNNAALLIKKIMEIGLAVDGLIDNDTKKIGQTIGNLIVEQPEKVLNRDASIYIFISVYDEYAKKEIKTQLKSMGYSEYDDFVDSFEVFQLFDVLPGYISGQLKYHGEGTESIKSFDKSSYLVKVKDSKCIYRVIDSEYESKYCAVYNTCLNNGLFDKYLVKTAVEENQIFGDNKYVLSHELIQPITYCFEWSPSMVIGYVKFMLDFMNHMTDCGLSLNDGHMLNATISKGKYIYIDFGAIEKGTMRKGAIITFLNTHIITATLLCKGELSKAYLYMKNPGLVYTPRDIKGFLSESEYEELIQIYEFVPMIRDIETLKELFSKITNYINGFDDMDRFTQWSEYQNDEWERSSNVEKWSKKMKNVTELIQKVNPKTLVDLAGNSGWYGSYYHDRMQYSIVIDSDNRCIDKLWERIKDYSYNNVYPVYMSICAPTLDYYKDEMIGQTSITPWRDNAITRFKSEMVIALAVIHHLAFSQQLSFEEIINLLDLYSEKYLIIEFVEKTDEFITYFLKEGFDWYNKINFEQCLNTKFVIRDTKPSTPSESRTLYLCEKRNISCLGQVQLVEML